MESPKDPEVPQVWAKTREEVKIMIAPHKDSTNMPPFSALKLMVIALVLNDGHASRKNLFITLLRTFTHFQEEAAEAFLYKCDYGAVDYFSRNDSTCKDYDPFYREASNLFCAYDSPIRWSDALQEFIVRPYDARMILDLDVSSYGSFSFFKLPAEIRRRIYGLLFTFPPAWIYVLWFKNHAVLKLHTNKDKTTFSGSPYTRCDSNARHLYYSDENVDTEEIPSMAKLLQPLLVSKEFYQEAAATFYSKHIWFFEDVRSMSRLLSTTSTRLRHFSYVVLCYYVSARCCSKPEFVEDAESAFKRLAKLENLRKLRIVIDEADTVKHFKSVQGKTAFKPEKIPGFKHLMEMRGLEEVVFEGECPQIRDALVPLLTAPKPQQDVESSG